MPVQFTAHLLLQRPWALDIEALARHLRQTYPEIGAIDAVPGANGAAGLLTIDNGMVVVMTMAGRLPEAQLWPPFQTLANWAPHKAVADHAAHLVVACGGDNIPGREGACAFGAATTFTAAGLAEIAPVTAMQWVPGWTMLAPAEITGAAEALLAGRLPIEAWISTIPIVPRGYRPDQALGLVTHGLVPFMGREVELAPARVTKKGAYRRVRRVLVEMLEGRAVPEDREEIDPPPGGDPLIVRRSRSWWRPDMPAFVCLSRDSVVDPDSLEIRPRRTRRRKLFERRSA